ncbi:MAG: response regulator transcription factor [Elusimicrobia bacterium]|nr:response regulator transcription factor [Elusimicrobiota bacterium]
MTPGKADTSGQEGIRYKILTVDDDAECLSMLRVCLSRAGHTVLAARSAREALLAAVDSGPDLVISDVQMAGDDGFELSRRLKAGPATARIPIILLSGASKDVRDQLEGFGLGVDDYLIKPFEPALLLAKVHAVLRRYAVAEELRDVVKSRGVELDVQARTVSCSGSPVALSRKEFDLLITLIRKRGHVLSPSFLLESVWSQDLAEYNDPRTVKVHISSLRKKLPPAVARRIMTVPGSGYRFDA